MGCENVSERKPNPYTRQTWITILCLGWEIPATWTDIFRFMSYE